METLHHRIAGMREPRDRFHGVTINNDYIYIHVSMIHLSMINSDECVNDVHCICVLHIYLLKVQMRGFVFIMVFKLTMGLFAL